MINRNKTIKITNRGAGSVGYYVQDLNITRHFEPGETKTITFGELESLSFTRGGTELIKNNLIIRDEEALKAIFPHVEPEYLYTRKDVKDLLENGSLDALLDCLDFAPTGVLDLVKEVAVDIELNDYSKRNAIQEKLNFDVSKAIEIKNTKFDGGDSPESSTNQTRKRRVQTAEPKIEQPQGRRTQQPIVDTNLSWKDIIKE